MSFGPDVHSRRSMRLKHYDYSQPGAYFITIVTYKRKCIFGQIIGKNMLLNAMGNIIINEWLNTQKLRPNVSLDHFVVMPNHFHAILQIAENRRGVLQYAPTNCKSALRSASQTIGAIIRGFKSTTTKHINIDRHTRGKPVWQRNYFEHVIRGEDELERIRFYIAENPVKWATDRENPAAETRTEEKPWEA